MVKITTKNYHIKSKISETSRTQTWLASLDFNGIEKDVVLKTIYPAPEESLLFEHVLKKEGGISIGIRHPNVISLLDYGRFGKDKYFLTTEHIAGCNLSQVANRLIRPRWHAPVWFILRLMLEICDGLQHAHNNCDKSGEHTEILHRYITPNKIFISFSGEVKIAELGLTYTAFYSGQDKSTFNIEHLIYLSPEFLKDKKLSRQGDVYSLGIIMYELLTGYSPYKATTSAELFHKITNRHMVSPQKMSPWMPKEVGQIIEKALEPDLLKRYQDVTQLSNDITAFIQKYDIARENWELGLYISAIFPKHPSVPENIRTYIDEHIKITFDISEHKNQQWTWLNYVLANTETQKVVDFCKKNPMEHFIFDTYELQNSRFPDLNTRNNLKMDSLDETDETDIDIEMDVDDTKEINIVEIRKTIAMEDAIENGEMNNVQSGATENINVSEIENPVREYVKTEISGENIFDIVDDDDKGTDEKENGVIEKKGKGLERLPDYQKTNSNKIEEMREMWDVSKNGHESWVVAAEKSNVAAYFGGNLTQKQAKQEKVPDNTIFKGVQLESNLFSGTGKDENKIVSDNAIVLEGKGQGAVYFEKGMDAILAKAYPEALKYLEAAIKADPDKTIYSVNLKRLRQLMEKKT